MPEPSPTTSPPQDVVGATLTGGVTADIADAPKSEGIGKPRSLWSDAWHDLRRNPMFVVSALLIMFLLLVAAFPRLLTLSLIHI